MKGTAMSNVTKGFNFPAPEEMRAIEMAARRAQAEETMRLLVIAGREVKAMLARAAGAVAAKVRHRNAAAQHGG